MQVYHKYNVMFFYFIGITNEDLLNFEYEAKRNEECLCKNVA